MADNMNPKHNNSVLLKTYKLNNKIGKIKSLSITLNFENNSKMKKIKSKDISKNKRGYKKYKNKKLINKIKF